MIVEHTQGESHFMFFFDHVASPRSEQIVEPIIENGNVLPYCRRALIEPHHTGELPRPARAMCSTDGSLRLAY